MLSSSIMNNGAQTGIFISKSYLAKCFSLDVFKRQFHVSSVIQAGFGEEENLETSKLTANLLPFRALIITYFLCICLTFQMI